MPGANSQTRKRRKRAAAGKPKVTEAKAPLADLIEGDDDLDEAINVDDLRDAIRRTIRAAWGSDTNDERYTWPKEVTIEDDNSVWAIVEVEGDGTPEPGEYRVDFTVDADLNVTITTSTKGEMVFQPNGPTDDDGDVTEAWSGDVVPLSEATTRSDGTLPICLITPGWGSSGYYSAEVLEAAAEAETFPAGTHMYWDHPSESDSMDRPERSLRDLAGVTVTPAAFLESGASGPGLYADAKPFPSYTEAITEMAPYIGVSIRAGGQLCEGTAEGRTGPIVESIDEGRSVDFVTVAGRGGHVLAESGRTVADTFTALLSDPTTPPPLKETEMTPTTADLTEAQRQLTEANEIGAALAAYLEAHRAEAADKDAEIERLSEAIADRDARVIVAETLDAEDAPELRETARKRVVDTVVRSLPLTEDGKLDRDKLVEATTEAAKAEAAYLSEASGPGRVTGMGAPAADPDAKSATADFFERRYGFTEDTSKDLAAR